MKVSTGCCCVSDAVLRLPQLPLQQSRRKFPSQKKPFFRWSSRMEARFWPRKILPGARGRERFPGASCGMEKRIYWSLTKPGPQLGRRMGDHLAECGPCPGQTEKQPYLLCIVCSFLKTLHAYASSAWITASWDQGWVGGGTSKERGEGCGPVHRMGTAPSPLTQVPIPHPHPPTWPKFRLSSSPALLKCHFPLQREGSPLCQT